MFKLTLPLDLEYHLFSKNNKAFSTSKADHLRHYSQHIVSIQHNVGLSTYLSDNPIVLPRPISLSSSFQEVLENRHSSRDFNGQSILLEELSTLLALATGYKQIDTKRKYVPSSGGFNEVEAFIIVLNVENILPGIYYYNASDHTLHCISLGNYSTWVQEDLFYQEDWAKASVIFILAAQLGRLREKYQHRAYRLCLLDVGHSAQNLYLGASALELKVCEVLGYIESEIEKALDLDEIITPTFSTIVIGK